MRPHADSEHIALDVLEGLLEGCQVVGFDYSYLYLNAVAVAHARRPRESLLGRSMVECFPGIDATPMFATLRACMEDRQHHRLENAFTYPDGSSGHFELRFVPVREGVCILSLDVTDRKRAAMDLQRTEAQLRHAQKMEAVGRLAGGMAHDFNNMLSVIACYTSFILDAMDPDDPVRADVREIQSAGERAAALTRQLLTFSRQQNIEPRPVDLKQLLSGVAPMFRRVLTSDVELTLLTPAHVGRVMVDPGTFEHALMNLVTNARDAMPRGGKLTFELANVDLDQSYANRHFEVEPGPYVMLAVSDTGVGMSEETKAHIFEPFYTTKEKDKGTGLGLSTAFGIVKQHGGHIWVYSELDVGTTFKIYLPRIEAKQDAPQRSSGAASAPQGSETILVVDDDHQLRSVIVTLLRRYGYRVLEAPNGGEALLISEQHPMTIHLLLTDLFLPHMNGRVLAGRVQSLRPDARVLFMSGYAGEAALQHGLLESGVSYLQKPVTPEGLAWKVREALDQRP